MDFLYKAPSAEEVHNLAQGDIIRKTDEVADVLRQAHAYYAENQAYFAFIVLTQSCDLARRDGGRFKAPYITVAAMKRADVAIREFEPGINKSGVMGKMSVVGKSKEKKLKQLIERLIHNTLDDHFYVPTSDLCQVPEPCVAYLRLSVALRKDHYDILLRNRVGQLTDVFRAKLGWLAGNIYSRVATPDIEDTLPDGVEKKKRIIDNHIPDGLLVLDGFQAEEFRRKAGKIEGDLTDEVVADILSDIPPEIDIVAQRVVDRLAKKKLIAQDDEEKKKIVRALVNEPVLKQLVNRT